MARKKKVVVAKESQPIIYSGNVIIKKIRNGKVISVKESHNSGYNSLFKFLLNCLAGDYIEASRPQVVMPCRLTNGKLCYVGNVPNWLNQKPKILAGANDSWYIEYTFLINYNSEFARGVDHLVLYSESDLPEVITNGDEIGGNYSMLVKLGDTVTSTGEDLLIIWQLQIQNPTIGQNNN